MDVLEEISRFCQARLCPIFLAGEGINAPGRWGAWRVATGQQLTVEATVLC